MDILTSLLTRNSKIHSSNLTARYPTAGSAVTEAQTSSTSLIETLKAAETAKTSAEGHAEKALKSQQEAKASLTTVQNNETTSKEQLELIKTGAASVTGKEAEIKKFFDEIDVFRKKITSTTTDSQETVKKNNEEIDCFFIYASGLTRLDADAVLFCVGQTLSVQPSLNRAVNVARFFMRREDYQPPFANRTSLTVVSNSETAYGLCNEASTCSHGCCSNSAVGIIPDTMMTGMAMRAA